MYLKIITLLVLIANLYANEPNILKSEISKDVSAFSFTIRPPVNKSLTLDVSIEQSYKKKLEESNSVDIVLLIDNTGSMGTIIEMIKNQIDDVSSYLMANYPNVNIAISSISEHSDLKGHDAYNVVQNFTNDMNLIKNSISKLQLDDTNNTDYEEAYLYGLTRSLELSWRQESQKIVFFIGDAWGHSPDKGKDRELSTADDLYDDAVLRTYREKQIKICSYFSDEHEKTKKYFTEFSKATNGFSKSIKTNSTIKDDFEETLNNLVGINYIIDNPFNVNSKFMQNQNHYVFDFDLKNIELSENNIINVKFTNNENEIGNIIIKLATGKPWGILILFGMPFFLIVSYLALKFIYKSTYTTTIVDFAYLRHYGVLALAIACYIGVLLITWLVVNQPNLPIVWYRLWW